MIEPVDLGYYRQREMEERRAARAAVDESARSAHDRLAEHYSDRVWALERHRQTRPQRA